jgi:chemotaxis protein methyltransferase CheR
MSAVLGSTWRSASEMNDSQCVAFLMWALPRLGMRWEGFRRVRRQVCRRVRRRLGELGLPDLSAYRGFLERNPEEWAVLDGLTHITISRFGRDRVAFELLEREVLPALAAAVLARGSEGVEVWSAGCAAGEEAYTLAIIWHLELAHRFPAVAIRILATDVDETMLARGRRGCFTAGSLKELPERWLAEAFVRRDALYCLGDTFKEAVRFVRHDIRDAPTDGPFDLVMCRNLAFTYFDLGLQRTTAARLAGALRPAGGLVLGSHEALPDNLDEFEPWSSTERVYRRTGARLRLAGSQE